MTTYNYPQSPKNTTFSTGPFAEGDRCEAEGGRWEAEGDRCEAEGDMWGGPLLAVGFSLESKPPMRSGGPPLAVGFSWESAPID